MRPQDTEAAGHSPEPDEKPRTAAQKWARVEKIDERIKELTAERAALTEELSKLLS